MLFFSLVLLIVPVLHLEGGDSEMLRFLPGWLGIGPLIAAFILYKSTTKQKNLIAVTSSTILGLLVFFHLSMTSVLLTQYDATGTGIQIRNAQNSNLNVAVFPSRLSDQFQFSGKLITPVVPQHTMEDAVLWSKKNPEHALLLFLDHETYPFFADKGIARSYKNGWLIFRPTNGFHDSYKKWIMKKFPN